MRRHSGRPVRRRRRSRNGARRPCRTAAVRPTGQSIARRASFQRMPASALALVRRGAQVVEHRVLRQHARSRARSPRGSRTGAGCRALRTTADRCAEGRRAAADVDRHVEAPRPRARSPACPAACGLEVQAAQHAALRARDVVLHEGAGRCRLGVALRWFQASMKKPRSSPNTCGSISRARQARCRSTFIDAPVLEQARAGTGRSRSSPAARPARAAVARRSSRCRRRSPPGRRPSGPGAPRSSR